MGLNLRMPRGSRSRLRHPLYPDLRLTPAARASGTCAALAGSCEELFRAAARGVRVERALMVLHYASGSLLDEADRERLWQMFQVPVLAIWLDAEGRVRGYECEAQRGLHIDSAQGLAIGRLESTPCECGRPGDRLILDTPGAKPAGEEAGEPGRLPLRPQSLRRRPHRSIWKKIT